MAVANVPAGGAQPRGRPVPLPLSTIGVAFSNDVMKKIRYIQQKNLLASSCTCICGTPMNLGGKDDISDKHIFRCPSCKTTVSKSW